MFDVWNHGTCVIKCLNVMYVLNCMIQFLHVVIVELVLLPCVFRFSLFCRSRLARD